MKKWTIKDMPSQKGKTALITGVGGLGFEDALALARAGARVIIAGRDPKKGEAAVAAIKEQVNGADISFELLDLADLSSVAACSKRMLKKLTQLDVLINNAGVMTPPQRLETKDGFELQLGTNYIGHVALTAHLLPLLKRAKGRIISLSSIAARSGNIHFDDLQSETQYEPMRAYAQSKLACLLFAFELQKKSDANNWGITSVAAHPGISRTELLVGNGTAGGVRKYAWFLFQPVPRGALSTLFAATAPEANPGGYYGPHTLREIRGYPTEAVVPKMARNQTVSERLWSISEELARVQW